MPLERVDDFIQRLGEIPKREDRRIWGLCLSEIKHLKRSRWTPAGTLDVSEGYTTLTLRSVLTRYRNAIRAQLGEKHPGLRYLKPSAADQKYARSAEREQVINDQNNLRPLDCEELVDCATLLITTPHKTSPLIVGLGIAMLTGRRPYEIFVQGNFTKHRARAKHLVATEGATLLFSGQAKTRGAQSAQTEPYDIPVLADPDLILRAFQIMRSRYDCSDCLGNSKKFNGRAGKSLSDFSARYFKDANGVYLSPKGLRSAYATTAFHWYAPPEISINQFFARVLGHSELDVASALSYIDAFPLGHKRDFAQETRRAKREAIVALEEQQANARDAVRRAQLEERIEIFRKAL